MKLPFKKKDSVVSGKGNNRTLLIFISSFAIVGLVVLISALAATAPNAKVAEGESSSATTNTQVTPDSLASGGNFLAFDSATTPSLEDSFLETFTGNTGLERFRWGVFHRSTGYREMDQPEPFLGDNNNSITNAHWTGDHDLSCGTPDTQRPLLQEGKQSLPPDYPTGWQPLNDFHTDELLYNCKDHMMSSMGDAAGFSVLWFAPEQSFNHVSSVKFKVNLTNLGPRKWWKVGVVSDTLWNAPWCGTDWDGRVKARCIVLSDVGASGLDGDLEGPDRLVATWAGAASAGQNGCMKIGNPQTGVCTGQNQDKATRYPVSFVDNGNGTTTFTVNGTSVTRNLSFPACPCHVVIYDQNYTPDKDGVPIGHTWHWDDIQVN